MGFIVDIVAKIVVLILLVDLVLQLQIGKEYAPYIKVLTSFMVLATMVNLVGHFFTDFSWGDISQIPYEEFYVAEILEDAQDGEISSEIGIDSIQVEEIEAVSLEEIKVEIGEEEGE